jgi:nanoRNase/pAp phosphatase (c-di-AMP/oligoRNAs hydrolase)
MDLNKVVATYVKIRDKRAEKKRAFEAEDADLKAKMERIEAFLLQHLESVQATQVGTDHGTFYRQKDVIPSAADWGAFYDWIKQNDAFDALERRIKKTFITQYMEANEGALPPGVNVFSKYVVRVRRSDATET